MPTSRNMTPHRVLPFVLTIPLLLLLCSVRMAGIHEYSIVFSGTGASALSHRLPLPIPWEDDTVATGLPVPVPDGKRAGRKVPRVRVLAPEKPNAELRGFRSGPIIAPRLILDSMAESLVLSRPPPAGFLPIGNGGNDGNARASRLFS